MSKKLFYFLSFFIFTFLRAANAQSHLQPVEGINVEKLEFPASSWRKVTPENSGWSAAGLAQADEIARRIRTDAYMVVHRGVVVHEFGATTTPSNLHSVRKSVLSILMGMQVIKGTLKLDDTLIELGINDKDGLTEEELSATVRHLLQARSGIYHPSAYEVEAVSAGHPKRGAFKPGENFRYNNWDFNALGTIFNRASDKNVFQSLRDDLAMPLQFEDFSPFRHTQWVYERLLSEHPAYVMQLSARDLARIGLLMARNGRWSGRQILDSAWVQESTTSYSTAGLGIGYGYMWWIGPSNFHFGVKFPGVVFSARGNLGQFVIVDPVRDLVIVHRVNSGKPNHANITNREFNPLFLKIMQAGPNLIQ